MMKRLLPFFVVMLVWMPVCLGNLSEYEETADGYLSTGEYVDSPWLEGQEKLIVNGGDATTVDLWGFSRLEVYSTSLPLSYSGMRGVYDIHLGDNSTLLFTGGATQSIKVGYNATAELRGGQINNITIARRPQDTCYVTIFTQAGYQMNASGISGLWEDGTAYYIHFDNMVSPYPPTANFINIEIIPEPASILLLGLGGLLLRKK